MDGFFALVAIIIAFVVLSFAIGYDCGRGKGFEEGKKTVMEYLKKVMDEQEEDKE